MTSSVKDEDSTCSTPLSPEGSDRVSLRSVVGCEITTDRGTASSLDSNGGRGQVSWQGGGDVENDASQQSRDRDAPGQNCLYVPPGDHRDEFYRLGTFGKFPIGIPVSPTDLATVGYYYTGYKDRVKCFSCGIAVENWIQGDDGMDMKWHRNDCPLKQGTEDFNFALPTPNFHSLLRDFKGIGNPLHCISGPGAASSNSAAVGASSRVPTDATDRVAANFMNIVRVSEPTYPKLTLGNVVSQAHEDYLRQINLRQESERRKTFAKWPSYPAPYLVSALAKDGFFYLGNLDRTQCYSCSGVLRNWAPHDDVREQHQKHFADCLIVQGRDAGNILMPDGERQRLDREYHEKLNQLNSNQREPPNPPTGEQRQLARRYPCNNAVNPHMQSLQRRIETFDRRWPKSRIRASVEQIAKAGFFFLGEGDKTKCFYCNGGLQNWDPNDEPWTEHAKWFPGCEFILRQKGIQFVRRQVDAHPNLNRPYIRNPVSYNDVPPGEVQRTSPNHSMETEVPASSNIDIAAAISMGFTKEQIDRFIQRKQSSGGYNSTEELIQDLVENGDVPPSESSNNTEPQVATGTVRAAVAANAGNKREGQPEEATAVKKTRTSSPGSSLQGSDIAESLRELEEEGKCRKCRSNKAEICLIPCGHLCLCENCAPQVKRCIICNAKIQSTMRIYRA